jgi:hypothetical protein
VEAGIASLIREAVMLALEKGEAVVGAVAPLRDSVPEDGSGGRRRRASPTTFIDSGLVVSSGQEPGSVWLRMEIEVLPEVELEVLALLPVHTGNVTGQAHVVAPHGISLSLTHTSPAPSKVSGGKSAVGTIVGAAIACLVCIAVVIFVARRRRAQGRPVKTETGRPDEEPRVIKNPLYQTGDDGGQFYFDVSSVDGYNDVESEGGYEQLSNVARGEGTALGMRVHAGEGHPDSYDNLGSRHCDTYGFYEQVGNDTHLSSTEGGANLRDAERAGRSDASRRNRGGNDDSHYFDVSCRAAQSLPGYHHDEDEEELYQELDDNLHEDMDEYLTVGSDDDGGGCPIYRSNGSNERR